MNLPRSSGIFGWGSNSTIERKRCGGAEKSPFLAVFNALQSIHKENRPAPHCPKGLDSQSFFSNLPAMARFCKDLPAGRNITDFHWASLRTRASGERPESWAAASRKDRN